MSTKSFLSLVPTPSLPVGMALDPLELAKQLERLRLAHGQSKEKAAQFTGISLRQYRRLTSDDPPPARLSTLEKVADAYGEAVSDLVAAVTHTNGSLTDRLERLEALGGETALAVQQTLRLLQDELLPRLADLELAAARTAPQAAARPGRTKQTAAQRRAAS